MKRRYWGVRITAGILILVGAIQIAVGVLFFSGGARAFDPTMMMLGGAMSFLPIVSGLFTIAGAQLMIVILDIEENTRLLRRS